MSSLMTTVRPAASLLLALLLCGSQEERAPWVKPPTDAQRAATPGLVHRTLDSAVMKTRLGYSVVLPAGYETSTRRYPVVYWLHGGGGNECSSLFTARSWKDLTAADRIEPVILVYPNAYRSGYMDHHSGKIMIESMIIKELIPRIDATFRTVAAREGRAVHGFSMGASGSLKFAIKYPQLFSAAVAYGGGAIDLENSTDPFIVRILKKNLNADPELIRKNNTYRMLEENQVRVRRNGIRFLLICGKEDRWKESAISFHQVLRKKSIPCELILVPDVRHDIRGLTRAEGNRAATFQDDVFKPATKKE